MASIDVATGAAATAVAKIARRNFMIGEVMEECAGDEMVKYLDIVI
jgi:hypothetical protein